MTQLVKNGALEGRYNLVVRNAKTMEVKRETGWFKNLITDGGLNRIGSGAIGSLVYVGSGSAAPSFTDTALQSVVASTGMTSNDFGAQGSAPYFSWARVTYRFGTGVAAGNLSEVGIGWSGGLFSRSLIRDSNGDPTTLTILSDEVLDVVYELRLYPPLVDQTFNVVISGVTHACVSRAALVTDRNFWNPINLFTYGMITPGPAYRMVARNGSIGSITQSPDGTGSDSASNSQSAYSNNSLKTSFSSTWGLGEGNVGGISAVLVSPIFVTVGTFQISFSPPIAKDALKVLTLNYDTSWARKT